MLFDFALDEVGTIRTLLHEELRPSIAVAFKTGRTRYIICIICIIICRACPQIPGARGGNCHEEHAYGTCCTFHENGAHYLDVP